MKNSLVRRAKEGDVDAFTELIESHMQCLYKTARAVLYSDEDAADAVQEAIISCWENIGKLQEERYFKTWMTRILVNCCRDLIRKKHPSEGEQELENLAFQETAYENLEWNETLRKLDEKYRLVMILYYVERFRTSEISEIMGIPEATVRTRLARGRRQLSEKVLTVKPGMEVLL